MAAANPEEFRQIFPEFADPEVYAEAACTFWITTAATFLMGASSGAANRYDPANLNYITYLFVAHHLVLGERRRRTAAAGGIPGAVEGPKTSAAADKVSKSMDTRAVTFEDEAFWNQTSYGIQLYNILRMAGAGGVQLGATTMPDASLLLGVPFGANVN